MSGNIYGKNSMFNEFELENPLFFSIITAMHRRSNEKLNLIQQNLNTVT